MTTLPLRRLGSTSLEATRLGLGLAALGRPAYITAGRDTDLGDDRSEARMAAQTHRVLDAAYDAGIRSFDAARSYGRAEQFLADWIAARDLDPGQAVISSKWGYTYVGGWRMDAERHEVKAHDLSTFARQWPATRELLWSHLDLYQVHSLTADSPLFDDVPLLDELWALKIERGVALGASVSGPEQSRAVDRLVDFEHRGARLFDTVQATFNLLEPSAGPALARARAAGLGVIVKEAVANGRLAGSSVLPEVADFAAERGLSPDVVALAAVLAQPWADVVLSGAVTPEQLASNLLALTFLWDADAEALFEGLPESPEAYWSARGHRPWQ